MARIFLDFGQTRESKKNIRIENASGDAAIFGSRVEAPDILAEPDRRIEQPCVETSQSKAGSRGSLHDTPHRLPSQEVDSPVQTATPAQEVENRKSELRTARPDR